MSGSKLSNVDVAARLTEIADLLDLLGEKFKPEAYRRAARSLEALPESLAAIAGRGALRTIPGVGEAIAGKVEELLRTGALAYLDKLRGEVPSGVLELMRLPGVGPKTARRFWVELQIDGPAALAAAVDAGRLAGVRGFADRKIAQLRTAATAAATTPAPSRATLDTVWPLAQTLVAGLRAGAPVEKVEIAGSFRRARETVGDLDILVTSQEPERVFDAFSRLPAVAEVRLRGPTKETVLLHGGLQVDLRVVEPEAFGAALQYFTGSKDHNVRIRSLARDLGLKVNEYGVYRGDERVAGRTEEEVYAALGLAWIPPEIREDRGEVAAAARGPLPALVDRDGLRCDPHAHLPPGAGLDGAERLRAAARARGFDSVGVVVGTVEAGAVVPLVAPELVAQLARGAPATPRLLPIVEGDGAPIPPGALDAYRPEYLVLRGNGSRAPGGDGGAPPVRLLAHAASAEVRSELIERARRLGAAVEVGPGPERFDSVAARQAREAGVLLSVPTGVAAPADDPTGPVALGFARRAGAGPQDLLNCRRSAPTTDPAPVTAGSGSRGRRRR